MIWYWESISLGKTKDGLGEEYLLLAKNAAGVMVRRTLAHKPMLVNDFDMATAVQITLRGMLKEIEGMRA